MRKATNQFCRNGLSLALAVLGLTALPTTFAVPLDCDDSEIICLTATLQSDFFDSGFTWHEANRYAVLLVDGYDIDAHDGAEKIKVENARAWYCRNGNLMSTEFFVSKPCFLLFEGYSGQPCPDAICPATPNHRAMRRVTSAQCGDLASNTCMWIEFLGSTTLLYPTTERVYGCECFVDMDDLCDAPSVCVPLDADNDLVGCPCGSSVP